MCAIASSTPATTLTWMIGARYSSYQSCSVASCTFAPGIAPNSAFACASQRISTPLAAKIAPMRGRNWAATPRATSRPSLALHGLYFCVLALSVTRSAISRSQGSST